MLSPMLPMNSIIAPSNPPMPIGVGVNTPTVIAIPDATIICNNNSGCPIADATTQKGKTSNSEYIIPQKNALSNASLLDRIKFNVWNRLSICFCTATAFRLHFGLLINRSGTRIFLWNKTNPRKSPRMIATARRHVAQTTHSGISPVLPIATNIAIAIAISIHFVAIETI